MLATMLATLGIAAAEGPLLVDLNGDAARQTVVDREAGQYLGHVSTVVLGDGKTVLAAYPQGHGRGPIVLKQTVDNGRTWSDRLPTPENWKTSLETPTLFRLRDPKTGQHRLVLFSGLYPIRTALSEDDGKTWSPLAPVGNWGGIVAMGSVVPMRDGRYRAYFHDDGRFLRPGGGAAGTFTMLRSDSADGGRTWQNPVAFWSGRDLHLCEPGAVFSPDGRTLGLLLRENRRTGPSYWITSADEGETWSTPTPTKWWLTGDRHTAKPLGGDRYLVSYRFMAPGHPWQGDWVAWIGSWRDLVSGGTGERLIRLKDNQDSWDCAYPGVEVLPGGEALLVTYGHWTAGAPPWILAVRLSPSDLART